MKILLWLLCLLPSLALGQAPTTQPLLSCGDALLTPDEQCDDGNTNNGDGCSSSCTIESAVCGDGLVSPGERCDDKNTSSGDGCSADCSRVEICGDSLLDPMEQCDDGNRAIGDGCDAQCKTEPRCGDGTVLNGEQCDDGNTINGDGCSAQCRAEIPPTTYGTDGNRLFDFWSSRYRKPAAYALSGEKSPSKALSLSLGVTITPIVIFRAYNLLLLADLANNDVDNAKLIAFRALNILRIGGLIFGPSAGQFYLGNYRMGFGTVLGRTLSYGGLLTGSALILVGSFDNQALLAPGAIMLLGGAGMYLYYAIGDIVWSGRFAKKHNYDLQRRPTVMISPTQNKGMTFGLQLKF
jgi:cysteine-rich repeat protein